MTYYELSTDYYTQYAPIILSSRIGEFRAVNEMSFSKQIPRVAF